MKDRFEAWARLSEQDRIKGALRALTEAELANLEPDLYYQLVTLRVRGAEPSVLIGVELQVNRRIAQLRGEGRMSPQDILREKVAILRARGGMEDPFSLFLAANRHGLEHRRVQGLNS